MFRFKVVDPIGDGVKKGLHFDAINAPYRSTELRTPDFIRTEIGHPA
jgi:hypothetical protein